MLAIQDISLAKGYLDNQDIEREREGGQDPSTPEGFKSVTKR
jgi:hypothetical protein